MSRSLALLVLILSVAGLARADIAPPKGIKRIPVEGKILAEKAFGDYLFFAVSGGDKATPLTIDPKTPATIKAAGGRYRVANLVAVPKDAAKKFDSDKEFQTAVAKGKVDGLVKSKVNFFATLDVKDSDTRKTAVQEYKLVKVDGKEIVLEAVKAEKEAPKNAPEEQTEEFSAEPKNGYLVSGIAAFLGVALAGLWIARRFR
jgi:hypothetical protein